MTKRYAFVAGSDGVAKVDVEFEFTFTEAELAGHASAEFVSKTVVEDGKLEETLKKVFRKKKVVMSFVQDSVTTHGKYLPASVLEDATYIQAVAIVTPLIQKIWTEE